MTITERYLILNIQIGITTKLPLPEIATAATALRNHFYAVTLPWKNNGDRLLPYAHLPMFMATHIKLVDAFNKAVGQFLDELDFNGLLSNGLSGKFYVNLDVDLVPEMNTEWSSSAAVGLNDFMEIAQSKRIERAMNEVWQRLRDALEHFVTKMANGGIYRNSTVDKLVEITEALPHFNVTDDPNLAAIGGQINTMLMERGDLGSLRKNGKLRSEIAAEAQGIFNDLERMRLT